jgi:HD-like signal output (HDOD) protein
MACAEVRGKGSDGRGKCSSCPIHSLAVSTLKRILFVDDDRNVLEGLGRLLRPMRNEWSVTFACGGPEAIATLQAQTFDVLVTDMRMPVVDGKALLTHVHDNYPQIVRVVLSGHTELASAMAMVPLAHHFLSKPCKAEDLKAAIERAGRVRDMLADERIRSIIGTVDTLPTPPSVYTKLTQVLARPNVAIEDVSRVMESDPAMCAKILHLVNSSFFGAARRTTSVRDAISHLGTNMIRNLVSSLAVVQVFGQGKLPPGFSPEQIGREGRLVAALARTMITGNRLQADEAFAAGLLHEVGQLVLAAYAPDLFASACRSAAQSGEPLHEAELQEYKITHAEVGAYLLALWGLPWSIVEAVASHHTAPQISGDALTVTDAVYIANALVEAATPQVSKADRCSTVSILDPAYLSRIGVLGKLPEWQHSALELAGAQHG